MTDTHAHRYRGARAMVILHETHLRDFLDVWKEAGRAGITLPGGEGDYASMETLLRHVLRAARGYMTWMCQVLELDDPGIRKTPDAQEMGEQADEYVEHLLECWRKPLRDVPEEKFYRPVHQARWKVDYCIDAMMEHAVMHPIRHPFQLRELMNQATGAA